MKMQFYRKFLLLILLVFAFASAIFLYFFSLHIDKKYSELIEDRTQVTGAIQKLSHKSIRGFFKLYTIVNTPVADSVLAMQKKWKTKALVNNTFLDSFARNRFLSDSDKLQLNKLINSRNQYTALCLQFFDLKNTASEADRVLFLKKEVTPAFKNYQEQLDLFLESNNKRLAETNGQFTVTHQKTGLLFLTLGISPVFLVMLSMIIIIMLVAMAELRAFYGRQ
jgi:hypothetical protein